jgi:hypothetical protein
MPDKLIAIERIKSRYHRSPSGALSHFGDCWWYCCQICTCGLHADLSWLSEGAEGLYPRIWEETARSDARREQLHDLPEPVINPPTEEEAKKMRELLEDVFKDGLCKEGQH